jgi:UDP-glucose 6-dehydrogenase
VVTPVKDSLCEIIWVATVEICAKPRPHRYKEVERGLKSEPRIGPGAYLSPGGPFAGGTLARDLVALTKIAEEKGEPIIFIPAVCEPMIQS